jgi:methane monooxygenase PmoA-like
MWAGMVMHLDRSDGRSQAVSWDRTELLRYVYAPGEAQLESPRSYFHPLRTLRGDLVSLYRPHDHVWHKGIAWSLPNVGPANFWGGPTYLRGRGYQQLPNNGRMRHDGFGAAGTDGRTAWLAEDLTWLTEPGERWFTERRRFAVAVWPAARAWLLAFETSLSNVSGKDIVIGSPTTEGRENAGYGGLFWRGPRSFTGGRVVTPDGDGGDEYMGWSGPWLGFAGRHDEHGRASTVLFCDRTGVPGQPSDGPGYPARPIRWFVRSQPFACVCPAPFFSEEHTLADGADMTFRYDVVVAEGGLSGSDCAALAAKARQAGLLDAGLPGAGHPGGAPPGGAPAGEQA